MKEKVLELKIVEINEEWSVWYITHQNEEVLPRGIFEDEELGVYSTLSPLFMIEEKEEPVLGLLGRWETSDNEPNKILNVDVPLLQKKVDQLNEKYGTEKIGNSGVDRDELKNDILTLQGICNVLYFDLDSLADEEMKNKLTKLKDMLEYILEAF
ncbi:hypothetical protein [Streptobacillus canis]|uniref:hypothetical protein n=1 Tax=Streptobacillus canis TaxID=2678686 RepID=UPI0012E0E226|nr:hypothetical protein [Streptobacillus canis]